MVYKNSKAVEDVGGRKCTIGKEITHEYRVTITNESYCNFLNVIQFLEKKSVLFSAVFIDWCSVNE